jgi:hypothetical protein
MNGLLTRLLGRYLGATPTAERRRQVKGHYAARSIYGSIVVLALLLALDSHPPSPLRAAGLVAGTVLAVLAAEAYAENLGAELDLGRRLTREERVQRFHELGAMTVSAEAPVAILLLAAVGVLDEETAFRLARWSTLALLLAGGYLARRVAGGTRLSAAWSGLLVFGLGVLVSVFKSLLHT